MTRDAAITALVEKLERWRNRLIDLQQGKRTGALRRQEAIELELLLADTLSALGGSETKEQQDRSRNE